MIPNADFWQTVVVVLLLIGWTFLMVLASIKIVVEAIEHRGRQFTQGKD